MKTNFSSVCYRYGVLLFLFFGVIQESYGQEDATYTIIIEGFDWGPAVNKVIVPVSQDQSKVTVTDYEVKAQRNIPGGNLTQGTTEGNRTVVYGYKSDKDGSKVEDGNYVTLVLYVSPEDPLGSPIQYVRKEGRGGNIWIDYKLVVTHTPSKQVWNKERNRILPLINDFDLTGIYKYNKDLSLSYAVFSPKVDRDKSPLIIWLHGGGEGGTDPSIPLIANKAANYASHKIQAFFEGAFVLAPQCPGAWMHNKEGKATHGAEDDVYHEGLMALIKDYVTAHPRIDENRIYIGGCSNGGYMALKLILEDPNYFAAAYISALAYQSAYISEQQIKAIKHVPIWFIHSQDDTTTLPEKTVLPLYKRLIEAGAPNVHLSYYKHVVDLTDFFGGKAYHFPGHWSWIYSHTNDADFDFGGTPVFIDDKPVTLMEWMAHQTKK